MGGGGMGNMGGGGHNKNNFQTSNNTQNNKGSFHHIYELLMCLFMLMFFYNLLCGKSNSRLTNNWYEANKEYFLKNYRKIGISEEFLNKMAKSEKKGLLAIPEKKPKDKNKPKKRKVVLYPKPKVEEKKIEKKPNINILQQEMNVFKFFAFNKSNVKSLIVNFEYGRTNDYFSMFSGGFLNHEKDRVIYQAALNPTDPIASVFCLCRGVEAKTFKKSYPDIDHFTRPYQPAFLSEYHLLFAESSEIFIDIFKNKEILAAFKKIEYYLEIMYFTDQKTFTNEEYGIYFGFELKLDQYGAKKVYQDINDFVHMFIDELCLIDISDKIRREAINNRIEFDKLKEKRQEEIKPKKSKVKNEYTSVISNQFQGGRIVKRKAVA